MNGRHRASGNPLILLAAVALVPALCFAAESGAKPADSGPNAAKTTEDIPALKAQLEAQQKQIEMLRLAMEDQKKMIERLAASAPAVESRPPVKTLGQVASLTPMVPSVPAIPMPAAPQAGESKPDNPCESGANDGNAVPPYLRIGSTCLTPVGFMDFTSVWRDKNPGSGIGSNFGGLPYGSAATAHLSEFRLSAQNSRVGFRMDGSFKGAHVMGYLESDFLGFVPTNGAVSSNSDSLRLRVYWVDVRKDKWEVFGGQSWTMMTPGRKGISPLPGDLFYSQNIDVNYQAGLVWSRQPEFRVLFHPSSAVTMGLALDAPEQYIGGSAGGGVITIPAAFATPYATQLNNGTTTISVPNLHPDIIGKIAFDASRAHFEVAGVFRSFKVYDPASLQKHTTSGGGGSVNFNFELLKGFRLVSNNYFSNGGGRYIFGQAPDVVVKPDGSLKTLFAGSTVSGLELAAGNTLFYAYYGGILIDRATETDANGKLSGYGYTGAPAGQNRTIQELTFGLTRTLWKNPRYGGIYLMGQYSYMVRNPWYIASNAPSDAHANVLFFNLRYALPGSAPTIK